MNAPFVVAQAGSAQGAKPVRVIKVTKPSSEQAVTIQLSYDGSVKLDLSSIANERMTLVRVGERLVILFDNQSTITAEPFFDSMGVPLAGLSIDLGAREVSTSEFATLFPITTDQSILPAAGAGGPRSGGDFRSASVDPLSSPDPLPLLPQEELGNFTINDERRVFDELVEAAPPEVAHPAGTPSVGDQTPASLDEDGPDGGLTPPAPLLAALTGGNRDGPDDADNPPTILTGNLVYDFGSDGPAAVDPVVFDTSALNGLGLTSGGSLLVWTWDSSTNSLLATVSGGDEEEEIVVLSLVVTDITAGAYTLTLHKQLDHAPPSSGAFENEIVIDLPFTITDGSGDTATGVLPVTIDDDSPTIDLADTSTPSLSVDETVLTDDSADFSGVFDPLYGADGPGGVTYALSINGGDGADSGLVDSLTGDNVLLYMNGNDIEGRNSSDDIVFVIGVASDGNVTLDQQRAVIHGSPDDGDISEPASIDPDLVILTATVEDGDGDTASQDIDLGSQISFLDDGPTAVSDTTTTAEDTAVTYNVITNANGTSDAAGADAPVTLTAATLATAGAGGVSLDANGNITFTPTAGFAGAAVINYTITDQDGDTSAATLTVTVAPDSTPQVGTAQNLTVDEDGFAFAAVDTATARSDETDSTESLTQSGTVVVNFGNDVPANLPASMVLLDTGALDNQLQTLDGQNVTFALVAGDLVGTVSAGATEVIRIHIVSAAPGPNAGDVTYTYSATLSQPLEHAAASLENTDLLSGVTFQVTDSDSNTQTGTFSVTVVDDVPQAVSDATTTAEDTAVTYNVITNANGTSDTAGADAPVTLTAATLATAGAGGVTFNANGDITFTPTAGFAGAAAIDYTITDQDGDTSAATLTVTVAPDSTPQVGTAQNLTVDEDGFAFAANDTLTARADETDSTESLTQSGTVVVNFGNDVPDNLLASIVLLDTGALDGQLQRLNGSNVTFALVGGDLVGSADSLEVIRIHIVSAVAGLGGNVTYTYSATLSQPLEHPNALVENTDLLTGVTFQVTDSDSNTQTGTFSVTVVDDVPTVTIDTGTPTQLVMDESIGSDGADGNAHLDDTTATGITVSTTPLVSEAIGIIPKTGTISLADLFTTNVTPGADGVGATTNVYSFTLTDAAGEPITATTTGVQTTLSVTNVTGTPLASLGGDDLTIWLFRASATEIVGKIGQASAETENDYIALRATLDSSGNLTIEQYLPIEHALGTFDDEALLKLVDENASLGVTLNASVTDGDGDSDGDTETVLLADATTSYLAIEDDGPSAPTLSANDVDVVHDETAGLQNPTETESPAGDANDDDVSGEEFITESDSPTVASLFDSLTGGDDPHVADNPIGYARSGASLVTLSGGSGGTDGEASRAYGLVVTPGNPSGASTTEGTQIFLYQESPTLVVGRVGDELVGGDTANPAGPIAFAIAINPATGEVFTAQYLSLAHGDFPSNYDEPVSLTDGAVQVTATITDGDGDIATSAGENIGAQIVFEDDGPTIVVSGALIDNAIPVALPLLNLDETVDPADPDDGRDGDDIYNGSELESEGGASNGDMDDVDSDPEATPFNFNTSPDPAGNNPIGRLATAPGALEALFNITDAQAGADGLQSLTHALSLTLTDGENDGVKTTLSVTQPAAGGNPDSDTADGDPSIFLVQISATEIWGVVGPVVLGDDDAPTNDIALKIKLVFTDSTDLGAAQIVVEQYMAIDHDLDDSVDPISFFDEQARLNTFEANDSLGLTLQSTITDGDGDSQTAPVTVTLIDAFETTFVAFDDDGPSAPTLIANTVDVVHDETVGVQNATATPSPAGDANDDDVLGTAFITGSSGPMVASLFSGLSGTGDDLHVADNPIGYARSGASLVGVTGGSGGTDGEASRAYGLLVTPGNPSGASTTEGTQIFLYQETSTLVVGRVGNELVGGDTANINGAIAFAIAINPATGEVFTAQYLSLQHPTVPNNYDEPVALTNGAVQVTATITDGDGDTATSTAANIGARIVFEDDGPLAFNNQRTLNESVVTNSTVIENFNAPAGLTYTGDGVTVTSGDDRARLTTDSGGGAPNAVSDAALETAWGLTAGAIDALVGDAREGSGLAKTFTTPSANTQLSFTYTFNQDSTPADTAFYFIKDSLGAVVLSGIIATGVDVTVSTIVNITVPLAGNYTLLIGIVDEGGTTNDSTLEIDNITLTNVVLSQVSGNVVTDSNEETADLTDQIDNAGSDGFKAVTQIVYRNESNALTTQAIVNDGNAATFVTVDTQHGSLFINEFGAYTYTADIDAAPDGGTVTDAIGYTIADGDGDTTTATLTMTVENASARILEGTLITNTNVTNQFVTLSFVEKAASDSKDSLHAAAKIYDLSLQGQQGSVIQDVGFNIDGAADYNVTLEASSGTKAIVTDFSLEGVTIQGSGNAQLEKNNVIGGPDSTAITAIIDPTPAPALEQVKTTSTDGDASGTTLSDAGVAGLNYYFGADGIDTLNGSTDNDVLNGGGGLDTLNGNAGNDMLVYDSLNDDVINGGSNPADTAAADGFAQEDWDILRVDDGALALSTAGSALDGNTLGAANNVTVDLRGKAISDIEIILLTEEAGKSTTQTDPNDDVGTTIQLNAADVLDYTDADNELWILGSPGDKIEIGGTGWIDTDTGTSGIQGTAFEGTDGQNFTVYGNTNGALLYIETEVQAQFVT